MFLDCFLFGRAISTIPVAAGFAVERWQRGGAVTAGSGAQLLAKVVPSSQALALIEADATMAVPPAGNIRKTTRLAMVPSAVTPRVVQFAAAPHVKSNGSLSR